LTEKSASISRRLFLELAALAVAAPAVAGCASQPPSTLRRNNLRNPSRRPRRVLAEAPSTVVSPPTGRSPLLFGEHVAGLYPGDKLAPWINLTFDDGPRPDWTPRVLKLLAEYGVTATFFVVGRLAKEYPSIIKQIVDEGHILGNHTYSHANIAVLSPKQINDEFDRTQDAIDDALGDHYPLRLIRPPYGSPWFGDWKPEDRQKVSEVIAQRDAFCILWHIGTADTQPHCTTNSVVTGLSRAIMKGRGGSLIFHPSKCAKQSVRSVLRMLQREEVATATPYHLLEAKYDCEWSKIASLPTRLG